MMTSSICEKPDINQVSHTYSLADNYPDLLIEWNYSKNNCISPQSVTAGSGRIVWWKCKLGHEWRASITNRVKGTGCPYCSIPAKRVLKGFNDLQTKYPSIANEWHPYRNKELAPDSVLCGSDRLVWWLGECGHEYQQRISLRVKGSTCPYCSHQKLLVGFNDFASEHRELLSEWDYERNTCEPNMIMSHSHYKAWWKCPFGHSYQAWMDNRCGKTHSGCPICNKENHTSFPEQALLFYIRKIYPDAINSDKSEIGMELDIFIPSIRVAIEYDGRMWHRNTKAELIKNNLCKNNNITLMRIRERGLEAYSDCYCILLDDNRSNICLSKAIEMVLNRIDSTNNIDIDVDRDAIKIYESYITSRKSKSLRSVFPELAKEWHPIKNNNLTSEMISPMAQKKVWWLGKCGHEWRMSVSDRTDQNCGCPICSGKRIISGINDLLSSRPDICEEWYYVKNNEIGLFPDKVAPHSDKKAWWKCNCCGNIWLSKIDSRTRMHAGCPECGKRSVSESKYKAVKCIETGMIYKSIKDASMNTGIRSSSISSCCKGRQKTAGKHHWRYV